MYHYCHHYSDEATTAFALSRAGREIWPPVSGRSNGVCILTTAFLLDYWTFVHEGGRGLVKCFLGARYPGVRLTRYIHVYK